MNKLYRPTNILLNKIIKRNYISNFNSIRKFSIVNQNSNSIINNQNKYKFFTTQTLAKETNNNTNTSTTNIQSDTIIKQPIEQTSLPQGDNSKYNITLTDSCVKELNRIQSQMKDSMLRVMVDMGGCSGYQYIIKIENKMQEDDVLFERDGAKVIIDKISLDMMVGSVIDYEINLMRSSFCVATNPNTIKSCGCKISFDLKK
ncbi:hypothetical protein DICPUDRAFT_157381 [Dictyostelium purpureum]|uniref:Core domain-containing protein n=1 Tax=Dictyostelium purpureum TaxID=5786 RepID=F0ZYZ9_DICPU|nr:uncharacterized protein DICPUDRAFT_157381 [Dictyostelium purpureum]EGC30833.1 hypothetical protein DICPUDRAFT_157381 [Dictyostelium purpureum]|eukprot:XP_003292647.1 hypothetical protein DICPUDRAFT_157381 [Dictyostelium purpureum]